MELVYWGSAFAWIAIICGFHQYLWPRHYVYLTVGIFAFYVLSVAVSWLIGSRDAQYANGFMLDVADRLANRVQLTTDGHYAYLDSVESAFGAGVNFATLVKLYGQAPESRRHYSSPVCVGARK